MVRQPVIGPPLLRVHEPRVEAGDRIDVQVLMNNPGIGPGLGTASQLIAAESRTITSSRAPSQRGASRLSTGSNPASPYSL